MNAHDVNALRKIGSFVAYPTKDSDAVVDVVYSVTYWVRLEADSLRRKVECVFESVSCRASQSILVHSLVHFSYYTYYLKVFSNLIVEISSSYDFYFFLFLSLSNFTTE
jgi:hypothetical protein